MTSNEREIIRALGIALLSNFYRHASIVCLYGIFCPLGILVVKNSMKSESSRRGIGCVMLLGILTATGLMIAQIGILAALFRSAMIQNTRTPLAVKYISTDKQLIPWNVLMNGCRVIPLLANDGLIIWRAWVIFYKKRWALWMLIILWILTAGAIMSTLVVEARSMTITNNLLSVTMGLSFSTNLIATSLIGSILWGFWKVIRRYNRPIQGFQGRANVWKILLCLVDVGLIYCLIQLLFMIGATLVLRANDEIKLPLPSNNKIEFSMILTALSPICNMLSSFYPVIITLLLKGPSVILGIHETAISIEELQVNRISIEA